MDARLTPESEAQCSLNIAHHANEAGDGGLLTGLSKVWQARFLQLRGNVCFAGHAVRWAAHRELTHVDDFGAVLGRALGSSQDNHADIVQVFAAVTGTSTLVPAWGQRPGNQQVDTIVQALHHAAEDDLRELLAMLLEMLGDRRPFWWATQRQDVEHCGEDAAALASSLGLGQYCDGKWMVVYDYTVRDAGLLWRPTVIESCGYAFHYPSPVRHGSGLTMALREQDQPCSEVLHHALEPEVAAQRMRPRLVQVWGLGDERVQFDHLLAQRAAHRDYLLRRFPEDQAWLDRHAWRDSL